MLLLRETSWENYDLGSTARENAEYGVGEQCLEQFLDKLKLNYTELKGLLESPQLYDSLRELRKYFTK